MCHRILIHYEQTFDMSSNLKSDWWGLRKWGSWSVFITRDWQQGMLYNSLHNPNLHSRPSKWFVNDVLDQIGQVGMPFWVFGVMYICKLIYICMILNGY